MGDLSREPSMEDILSSIRRVIARDEAPGTAPAASAADDVLDLSEEEADEAEAGTPAAGEELVSSASADAARQSLDALSAAVTSPASAAGAPAVTAAGGRTMEEVVMDALRPMLKQWLDTNLPGMVETMVAKDISRITGRRL
jgi:cell pole-organizing protein PopZ